MSQEHLGGKPTLLQSGCNQIQVRPRVRQLHAAQSLIALATRARQVSAVPLLNPRPRPTVATLNPLIEARWESDAELSFPHMASFGQDQQDCSRRGLRRDPGQNKKEKLYVIENVEAPCRFTWDSSPGSSRHAGPCIRINSHGSVSG